jgi:hypothetical protein
MRNAFKIFLLLFAFTFSVNGFSQDKLEKSKRELLKGAKRSDSSGSNRSHASSGRSYHEGPFEYMIFNAVAQGVMFVSYYAAIGNYQKEDHLHRPLTNYPYFDIGQSGNYEGPDAASESVKAFRVDLGNQYLHSNGGLRGNHLKLKIRPFQYFYLQADYYRLTEKRLVVNTISDLSLFNFNLCYDRVRLEHFNLGWTLGCNYIGSDVRKTGFSYGLNAEFFVAKNVSLLGSMKWSLINDSKVNELEILGKYHIKRFFISGGYEHLKIGSPLYDFVSIGGGIYL